jgi:Protein of unknown function (DUF3703)
MSALSPRIEVYDASVSQARHCLASGDARTAFGLLERAHVLGQRDFGRHINVHVLMLRVAWLLRDGRGIRGQLLRTVLVPLGHLLRRLPAGNTGGANVNAFEPMAIAPDLARLLDDKDR